jgi:hypothetical protein
LDLINPTTPLGTNATPIIKIPALVTNQASALSAAVNSLQSK